MYKKKTNLILILKNIQKNLFRKSANHVREKSAFTYMYIRSGIKDCSNNSFVYLLYKICMHSENNLDFIIKNISK